MLVIDASVAIKFVARESGTDQANALILSGQAFIAPDWMLMEAAEALRKKTAAKELRQADATEALDALQQFFERFEPATSLLTETQDLAFQLSHSVYDCLYLALAMREGVPMITADRKFWNASRRAKLDRHVLLFEWPGQKTTADQGPN